MDTYEAYSEIQKLDNYLLFAIREGQVDWDWSFVDTSIATIRKLIDQVPECRYTHAMMDDRLVKIAERRALMQRLRNEALACQSNFITN